jgi:hypothetical protein
MRDDPSEFMERGTVEKAVHPRAIADRISRLFKIVKDDGVFELRHRFPPLLERSVKSVVNEPFFLLSERSAERRLPGILHPLPRLELAMSIVFDVGRSSGLTQPDLRRGYHGGHQVR